MAFESLSENVSNTGKKTQDYIDKKAEYYKLSLFKSSMKFTTSLINMLVLGSIISLCFFFVSFGIAQYLSRILQYPSAGFFIMGGFYLLVFLLTFLYGKKVIIKAILEKFSKLIIEDQTLPQESEDFNLSDKIENQ